MDTASAQPVGPSPPIHTVVTVGPYGTVLWTPPRHIWDVLPTSKRVTMLDASKREFDTYFRKVVVLILEAVEIPGLTIDNLNTEVSLEELTDENAEACSLGSLVWLVSQGLWDAMGTEDRREGLRSMHMSGIHVFLHKDIVMPYIAYLGRRMLG